MIQELLAYYDVHRRILPWREDPAPYHVWLSEIMLQQTRVEAVKGYYARFLEALPDIASLAAAEETVCLKLWEGLGYYSRVRNLHKAAVLLVEQYGGELPKTAAELKKLPGIGEYTAAAIASIAYGERIPAVDGNLLRVFARLMAYEKPVSTGEAKKEAAAFFKERMQEVPERPGDINQAFMDLGALICLPNASPLCEKCPLARHCRAHALAEQSRRTAAVDLAALSEKGSTREEAPAARTNASVRETDYPVQPPKKARRAEQRTVLRIRIGEKIVLRKRPEQGLLAGLFEFPNVEGHLSEEEAFRLAESLGFLPLTIRPLPEAKHIFTHIEWHMIGYEVQAAEPTGTQKPGAPGNGQLILAAPKDLQTVYTLPTAFVAYRRF